MNNILYTQNESATKSNTIVVDGESFNDMNTGVALEAFRFVNKKSSLKGDYVRILDILKKMGKVDSQNLQFKKDDDGVFIKACFKEKDELGRKMPFLYYCKTDNMMDACKQLMASAKDMNRTCFENDIKALLNISKYVAAGVSTSLIILILIIWKMLKI